jgi:hypothetical protein
MGTLSLLSTSEAGKAATPIATPINYLKAAWGEGHNDMEQSLVIDH